MRKRHSLTAEDWERAGEMGQQGEREKVAKLIEDIRLERGTGLKKKFKVGKEGNPMRRDICDFARDNDMIIHPGRGHDYFIESFFMFKHCPCDSSRKRCPCDEAVAEVAGQGHCKCKLFWRSYDDFKIDMIGG